MRHLLKLAGMKETEGREILRLAAKAKKSGERNVHPKVLWPGRSGP